MNQISQLVLCLRKHWDWCVVVAVQFVFVPELSALRRIASSPGKWRGAHRVVGAHQRLPARHHPHRLWRRAHRHLPHEEPHVLHPAHQEATGRPRHHHLCTLQKAPHWNAKINVLNTALGASQALWLCFVAILYTWKKYLTPLLVNVCVCVAAFASNVF